MVSLSNHDLADEPKPVMVSLSNQAPVFLNLIETAYKEGLKSDVILSLPKDATLSNAEYLMQGVFQGFGGDFSTFAYDTPDYRKLAHIEANVYQFSGAKNYHQLRDLTRAIKDGTRILPFSEYKVKAMAILDEYQGSWLQTEYNAAIAGSQMASKWLGFQKNPDVLLQYRTMEDGRVRNEHALLNNVLRPVSDNFWKTYYPPNGWNCRCTVIERNIGKPTPGRRMHYPDVPKMFSVNLGERGLVFPEGSAYFKELPPEVLKTVETITPDRTNPKKQ